MEEARIVPGMRGTPIPSGPIPQLSQVTLGEYAQGHGRADEDQRIAALINRLVDDMEEMMAGRITNAPLGDLRHVTTCEARFHVTRDCLADHAAGELMAVLRNWFVRATREAWEAARAPRPSARARRTWATQRVIFAWLLFRPTILAAALREPADRVDLDMRRHLEEVIANMEADADWAEGAGL